MEIDFEAIVFVILSAAAIIGALGCVYARRVAHSLLSLMLTFLAVAGVMVMASAERLIDNLHFCLNNSNTAEIRVPA